VTAAQIDLNGEHIIEQNSAWSLQILYPGNVLNARLKGQIRKGYGGELIADFRQRQPIFREADNKTLLELFFSAQETEKIPIPPNNTSWIYDVLIYLPGREPFRLIQGRVFVSPGVTDV
jgi:hypothetical protein